MSEKVAVHAVAGQEWDELGRTSAGEFGNGDLVQIRAQLPVEDMAPVEAESSALLAADARIRVEVQEARAADYVFDAYEGKLGRQRIVRLNPLAIHLAKLPERYTAGAHSPTTSRTASASSSISPRISRSMTLSSSRISSGSRCSTRARLCGR